jgi:hypothetical protein
MAATVADRHFIFNTFTDIDYLEKMPDVIKKLIGKKTVGDVYHLIEKYR